MRWGPVAALGVTQNIGYGTLLYAYAVVLPQIAESLDWSMPRTFGLFSAGLLIGGLAAPLTGRLIDLWGARRAMTLGSLLAAVALAALSRTEAAWSFVAAIVLAELAGTLVLYDAAFAALAQLRGAGQARRSITHLTLIAGFASTLFWPLTLGLTEAIGWRGTLAVYAAANLLLALPIHWSLRPQASAQGAQRSPPGCSVGAAPAAPPSQPGPARAAPTETGTGGAGRNGAAPHGAAGRGAPVPAADAGPRADRRSMAWMVLAFSLTGAVIGASMAHWVAGLTELGLSATAAVIAGMLIGPAKVLGRVLEMLFGARLSPRATGQVSTLTMASAFAVLLVAGATPVGAALFAVLFGMGQGLTAIVRGTLPLALFGTKNYATRLGWVSLARMAFNASAPAGFAVVSAGFGGWSAFALLGGLCLAAAAALGQLPASGAR